MLTLVRNFVLAAGFLTVVAFLASPVFAKQRRSDDGLCRARIEATGESQLGETLARRSARIRWSDDVRTQVGAEFQTFSNARNPIYVCADTGSRGYFKRCRVSAVACRNASF